MSCAKTAEPIEMPFGLRTQVDPRNHLLDEGFDPPQGKGQFSGLCRHRKCIVTAKASKTDGCTNYTQCIHTYRHRLASAVYA